MDGIGPAGSDAPAPPAAGRRLQRLVFGEDADLYDRSRPSYPDALVDDVLAVCAEQPGGWRALEIGAGTGKATVAFAARGVDVLALEPDPSMAAVAARRCRRYGNVRFEHAGFEEWAPGDARFRLVYSAQAWHWLRPEVRNDKAAAVLEPGGVLALFWHRSAWPPGDPLRDALDDAYRRHSPSLRGRPIGFPGLTPPGHDTEMHDEVVASGRFADVSVLRYPWTAGYDGDGYVGLLATQSDHRLLGDDERRRLFASVRALIEERGGRIRVPYETDLVLARLDDA